MYTVIRGCWNSVNDTLSVNCVVFVYAVNCFHGDLCCNSGLRPLGGNLRATCLVSALCGTGTCNTANIDCNMADVLVHPAKLQTFIVYIAPVITSLMEVLHDDKQEKLTN